MSSLAGRQLADLAASANEEHAAAEVALGAALQHAVNAGRLLLEAKRLVGHGGWGGWLEENFRASARTAQGYMRVAARFPELEAKTQHVAEMPLREALRLLAEPKVGSSEGAEQSPEAAPMRAHLDDKIEHGFADLRRLIAEAHAMGAAKRLGYATWREYVDAELLPRYREQAAQWPADLAAFMVEQVDAIAEEVAAMDRGEVIPDPTLGPPLIPPPGHELVGTITTWEGDASHPPVREYALIEESSTAGFYYVTTMHQWREQDGPLDAEGTVKPVRWDGIRISLTVQGFPWWKDGVTWTTRPISERPGDFNRWLFDSHSDYVQRWARAPKDNRPTPRNDA